MRLANWGNWKLFLGAKVDGSELWKTEGLVDDVAIWAVFWCSGNNGPTIFKPGVAVEEQPY